MNIMRILIMFFIVFLIVAALFFYFKKQERKKVEVEGFTEMTIDDNTKAYITKTFNTMLGRDPYNYEIKLYKEALSDPANDIEKSLRNSAEYKLYIRNVQKEAAKENPKVNYKFVEQFQQEINNTDQTMIQAKLDQISFETKLDLYKQIVKAFEGNLARLPAIEELNYFTYKLTDGMDIPKLETLLQSSEEYKILQKNQTNLVNSGLVANITDAQMTLLVNETYVLALNKDLTNEQYRDFLKQKLQNYALDVAKLKNLIVLLDKFDANLLTFDGSSVTSAATTTGPNATTTDTTITDTTTTGPNATTTGPNATTTGPSATTTGPNATITDTTITGPNATITGPNATITDTTNVNNTPFVVLSSAPVIKETLTNACKNGFESSLIADIMAPCMASSGYKDKARFFDDFYSVQQHVVSDGSTINAWSDKVIASDLAETQHKRNAQELKYTCANNSYYSQLEKQMQGKSVPYDPTIDVSRRNTKNGAFLEDAYNTRIGSIMPVFMYKEFEMKN